MYITEEEKINSELDDIFLSLDDVITKIVKLNLWLANFWGDGGWATEETRDLLSKSRLDRIVAFSYRLKDVMREVPEEEKEAHLINSWIILGSLIESSMALFVSVYRNDYLKNPRVDRKGETIETDKLALEDLKCIFIKHELINKDYIAWIQKVQAYRNTIHYFKDKAIGDVEELQKSIRLYRELIKILHSNLPYPDELYVPRDF